MSSTHLMTPTEVDAILCKEGAIHELETRVIDGRLMRVYKNIPSSLRTVWLWAANEHKDKTYIVFENQRLSYQQVLDISVKWAAVFREVYGIEKGDRIAICSRNYPSYIVAFWACQLIGAVSVLVNSMLARDAMEHCIKKADTRLVLVDPQRADLLEPIVSNIDRRFAVIESHEGKGNWNGMDDWKSVVDGHRGDPSKVMTQDLNILPEDDSVIMFTSGTTGLPKGVLATQRAYLTAMVNNMASAFRAMIQRGEDPSAQQDGPQKAVLLPTPLFHVTGLCTMHLSALSGGRVVLTRRWDVEKGAQLIKKENITRVVGVPTLVHDLVNSSLAQYPFENVAYGGAPTPESLVHMAKKAFPTAELSQSYGLTETSATAISCRGEDYMKHPKSVGRLTPINDCIIMNPNTLTAVPRGQSGEVWLRGPNIMKEYWRDQEATDKALTKDGWFRTGDIGYMDGEGYVYILDRAKDIIIRGGENIDSLSVENALYAATPEISEAAAVGVPDNRLGEVVAALVTLRPGGKGKVSEKSLLKMVSKFLPRFAIPVMIVIREGDFEHTPSGKIIKNELKKIARYEWNRRSSKSKL